MTACKRLLACGVVAAALALLGAQAVLAHSRPIRFDPAPGAVFNAPPAQVSGWFTSDIRRDPNWSFLRVTDAQGNRVDSGETAFSVSRRQMSVNLRSGLGPGRYLVAWRTFDDDDGAILGDCYTFFIGQAAADQAVADNARLDGGRSCQRIDVEAKSGTPAPNFTPPAGEGHVGAAASTGDEAHEEDEGSEVPLWALVLGVAGGIAVGVVGGRMLSARS